MLPALSRALSAPTAPQDPVANLERTKKIVVDRLIKDVQTSIGPRRILDGISFEVAHGEKIGVLGRNGAGKSTLVKIIGGVDPPSSGHIQRGLFMSWPLGFSGGLGMEMTGIDNVRFIARLYDRPVRDMVDFVDDFAELGRQMLLPMKYYSSGMQMRLAFALTIAINFECFLIDEVLSVGDARFHQKCHDALFVQRKSCAMILISHDTHTIRNYCNKALVLKAGRARLFDDVDFAIKIYQSL
ncbi:MAG: ABC transporter ATP-binding protein [Sphingopyxis sp.]|nr:ABC transporter ATP-binding protein [Sphingopyxis sp.]